MSTWYKMYRGWQKHPALKTNDHRMAWVWLIEHAMVYPTKIDICSEPFPLERGQLYYSIRYLATAWGVSKSQVETILKSLKNWDMIRTDNRTGRLIITICEYSKYQDKPDSNRTAIGQKLGQQSDSNRTNNKNDKEYIKKERIKERVIAHGIEEIWDDFTEHRNKIRKPMTSRASSEVLNRLDEFKLQGYSPHSLLATAIERGWQTVYEPRKENEKNIRHKTKSEQLDDITAEYLAERGIENPRGNGADRPHIAPVLRSVQHLRTGPQLIEEHSPGVRGSSSPIPSRED